MVRSVRKRGFVTTVTVCRARQPSRSAKSSRSIVSVSLQIIAVALCQKYHSPKSLPRSGVTRVGWEEDKPETRGCPPEWVTADLVAGWGIDRRWRGCGMAGWSGFARILTAERSAIEHACDRTSVHDERVFRNPSVTALGRVGGGRHGAVAVSARRWNVANARTRLGLARTKCLRQSGVCSAGVLIPRGG